MLSIYCFLLFMPIITSNVSFLDSLVKTTDRNRSDRTKTNNRLPDQAVHRSVVETILENRLLLDNSIQVQFSPPGLQSLELTFGTAHFSGPFAFMSRPVFAMWSVHFSIPGPFWPLCVLIVWSVQFDLDWTSKVNAALIYRFSEEDIMPIFHRKKLFCLALRKTDR